MQNFPLNLDAIWKENLDVDRCCGWIQTIDCTIEFYLMSDCLNIELQVLPWVGNI